MARSAEGSKERRDQGSVVDADLGGLREIALEQPGRDASPTLGLLLADQRRQQQELLGARPADLAQRRFRDQQIAPLECSSENRSRVPLGRDRFLSWGRSDATLARGARTPTAELIRLAHLEEWKSTLPIAEPG